MTSAPAAGASAPLSDRNQFEALFAVYEQHEKTIMMGNRELLNDCRFEREEQVE
jgi:hypothetical protein